MAMTALAVSSSAAVLASASSTRSISTVSQQRRCAPRAIVVRCASQGDSSTQETNVSRREIFSLATLSLLLASADKAQAKDVPLFGIRKQLEKAGAAVESEVKELAKQGEKELESVSASLSDIQIGAPVSGFSPVVQAGGVIGAELVAVLVAATVVNGLVSVPSK